MRRTGEMAERSNAAVLKTVDCNRSGGSNPSFSAEKPETKVSGFLFLRLFLSNKLENNKQRQNSFFC